MLQPAPPTAQATAPNVGRMEGDAPEDSSNIMAVAERTGGELSLALMLQGSHSPARGEPLLRWTNLEDSTLTRFTLDDATESMERESLNVGVTSVLEALDHAQGALAYVVVPVGRVLAKSCFSLFHFSAYYCILTIVFFQSLIARSRGKSRFLCEQKEI